VQHRVVARQFIALRGGSVVETNSGPVVDEVGDGVTVDLGDVSHALSFGQILPDEAVGAFIGAPLPGVRGCGEEDGRTGLLFDGLVAVELGTVVEGDGADGPGRAVDEFDGAAVGLGDGSVAELADP